MKFSQVFSEGLAVLALLLSPCACQTSTVNGRAEYSGTPVLANPNGIPTLTYNCAKMPSICDNVHANGGNYELRSELNAAGQDVGWKGTLRHVDYLELNLDKGGEGTTAWARKEQRRKDSCPSDWKATAPACPRQNQPVVVLAGHTVSNGFVGQRLNPNIPQGDPHSYRIADPNGNDKQGEEYALLFNPYSLVLCLCCICKVSSSRLIKFNLLSNMVMRRVSSGHVGRRRIPSRSSTQSENNLCPDILCRGGSRGAELPRRVA